MENTKLVFSKKTGDFKHIQTLYDILLTQRVMAESPFTSTKVGNILPGECGGFATEGICIDKQSWVDFDSVVCAVNPSDVAITEESYITNSVVVMKRTNHISNTTLAKCMLNMTSSSISESKLENVSANMPVEFVIIHSNLTDVSFDGQVNIRDSTVRNISNLHGYIYDAEILSDYDYTTQDGINVYMTKIDNVARVTFNSKAMVTIDVKLRNFDTTVSLEFQNPLSRYYYESLLTNQEKKDARALLARLNSSQECKNRKA